MANIINFDQLTPQMKQDLSDIIVAEAILGGTASDFMEVTPAESGKRIPVLYPLSKIGKVSRGCSPAVDTANAELVEKTWALKEWDFKLKQCYKDVEQALYNLGLKTNTEKPDLTGTPLMNLILRLVEPALDEMILRFAFFGDTAANNHDADSDEGSLTSGVDPNYFKLVDGIWKQIAGMVTSSDVSVIDIPGNDQASTAAQKSATVDALGILSSVINDAPIDLRQVEAGREVILVTDLFMQKLRKQIYAEDIQTEAQFAQRQNGIQEVRLYGHTITSLPYLDKEIEASFNNGTKLDNPYRVLYTTKDNLLLGIPQGAALHDFDVWYNMDDRNTYIQGIGDLDVKVVRPELISVAY